MTYVPRSSKLQTVHHREISLAPIWVGCRNACPNASAVAAMMISDPANRNGSERRDFGSSSFMLQHNLCCGTIEFSFKRARRRGTGASAFSLFI